MRVPDSVARLDTVSRTSFRQAYSLTNLANRFVSSPVTSQKSSNREAESAVSGKLEHVAPYTVLSLDKLVNIKNCRILYELDLQILLNRFKLKNMQTARRKQNQNQFERSL